MTATAAPNASLLADSHYLRLKEHLIAVTGLAYYADRDDELCTYVNRRLTERSVVDCASYLRLLLDGEAGCGEMDKLIEQLTIGETFFFRHREVFEALRDDILPDLIRRNQATRRLRIWSAGCSFGAEPYSISILLRRELAHLIDGWDISILATDVNRDFLSRAQNGSFEEWAFRGVSNEIRQGCFLPEEKTWRIAPAFREGITFQYHNLVLHPFPSMVQNLFAFDLILCRNVMIYFSRQIMQRVVAQFHDSLVCGGWLLVGHAEPNVEIFRSYRTVNAAGAVAYQKPGQSCPPRSIGDNSCGPPLAACVPLSPEPTCWTEPPVDKTGRLPPAQRSEWSSSLSLVAAPSEAAMGQIRHAGQLGDIRASADAGQLEHALGLCQDLLADDQLNPAVHLYQALILEQLGRHQETALALRRAIYLDRTYVLPHYYLGLTARRQQQPKIAIRSFRNVLEILKLVEPHQPIPDADDLCAGELEKLTRMHMAALEEYPTPHRRLKGIL